MVTPEFTLICLAVSVSALIILLFLRVPVAGALLSVGVIGVTYIQSFDRAMALLKVTIYHYATNWAFTSLPMYLIMGYLVFHMGVAEKMFNLARLIFHRVPGALAISTAWGCAAFGAVCGSGLALSFLSVGRNHTTST